MATISPGIAQDKAHQPGVTIKTDVRQVLVPVVVTNKSGHYVTELSAADFRVFEDGTPQKIVAFSRSELSGSTMAKPAVADANSSATVASRSSKALSAELPKRTYLVCVDALHSLLVTAASTAAGSRVESITTVRAVRR